MRKCKKCCKNYPKEVLVCPECGQDLKYPEGKKFAIITLILMVAPIAIEFMEVIINNALFFGEAESTFGTLISTIAFPASIAGFVLAMIGHAKYPGNVFCTVLFWIAIGEAILAVISLILVIVVCGMIIDVLEGCREIGLILLR